VLQEVRMPKALDVRRMEPFFGRRLVKRDFRGSILVIFGYDVELFDNWMACEGHS
jgi:hypothetical protein